MHLETLLPINVLVAMALAQSLRSSFQTWRDERVLHQNEPVLGQAFVDDLKMASAVTIAAAVMIPAILVYAFGSWLIRSMSRWTLRTRFSVKTQGVAGSHVITP